MGILRKIFSFAGKHRASKQDQRINTDIDIRAFLIGLSESSWLTNDITRRTFMQSFIQSCAKNIVGLPNLLEPRAHQDFSVSNALLRRQFHLTMMKNFDLMDESSGQKSGRIDEIYGQIRYSAKPWNSPQIDPAFIQRRLKRAFGSDAESIAFMQQCIKQQQSSPAPRH